MSACDHRALVGALLPSPTTPLSPSARSCSAHPPIAIEQLRMTSVVGWRVRPDGRLWHAGLDLRGGVGTPVYAVRDGVCVISVPDNSPGFGGYGVSVVLWHPEDRVFTHYAHLSARHVERGAVVRHGQLIAEIGRTSSGTWPNMGAHLHFEVRRQVALELRGRLRARTLRHDGLTLAEGSPYPGPYPDPTRDTERFEAVWVNPLAWLASLGIQGPELPWGGSSAGTTRFGIVRGSAADCESQPTASRSGEPAPGSAEALERALAAASSSTSREGPRLASVEPEASPFDGLPFDALRPGDCDETPSIPPTTTPGTQLLASPTRSTVSPWALGGIAVAVGVGALAIASARGSGAA